MHCDKEITRLFVEKWVKDENRFALVLKENGKLIGHIALKPDSEEGRADTKELGFALNDNYKRKGYMSEAVTALLERAFEDEKTKYIWACCFSDNLASKALIEKCGFTFIQSGKFYSQAKNRELPTLEYRIEKSDLN